MFLLGENDFPSLSINQHDEIGIGSVLKSSISKNTKQGREDGFG